jgi:acyl-CoA thioesterase FadM
MARIKIELPQSFSFTCRIPVRITDINYGGHAGNDTVLSIIHEASRAWGIPKWNLQVLV